MDLSLDTANVDLWPIAEEFRRWVSRELDTLAPETRAPLRGDYLFVISGVPRFVVVVTEKASWSGRLEINSSEAAPHVVFDVPGSVHFSKDDVVALVAGGARTTIHTDCQTLKKLLLGAIKARVAFLSGKVRIEGDLPGFIRLTTLLKGRGVRPLIVPDAPSQSN